jgi:hypothetical protein
MSVEIFPPAFFCHIFTNLFPSLFAPLHKFQAYLNADTKVQYCTVIGIVPVQQLLYSKQVRLRDVLYIHTLLDDKRP